MKFLKSKSGKLNSQKISTIMLFIVLIVVVFQVYAEMIPEAQAAGENIACPSGYTYNSTGAAGAECSVPTNASDTVALETPLGGLFSTTGVVFIIIMAALLITVVRQAMKGNK